MMSQIVDPDERGGFASVLIVLLLFLGHALDFGFVRENYSTLLFVHPL